jgi:hypothetical protein
MVDGIPSIRMWAGLFDAAEARKWPAKHNTTSSSVNPDEKLEKLRRKLGEIGWTKTIQNLEIYRDLPDNERSRWKRFRKFGKIKLWIPVKSHRIWKVEYEIISVRVNTRNEGIWEEHHLQWFLIWRCRTIME